MKRLTVPAYFMSMTSAIVMMDSIITMSYFKAFMFAQPFWLFLSMSTYMTQISYKIIKRIDLIEKTSDMADELLIQNLRGETETIPIEAIRPLKGDTAREALMNQSLKSTYPVMVGDLMMIIDKKGTIHNIEILRAVLNGYKIDLS